jgi:hypothetical protein
MSILKKNMNRTALRDETLKGSDLATPKNKNCLCHLAGSCVSLDGSGQPAVEIAMSAENVETKALNTPIEKNGWSSGLVP